MTAPRAPESIGGVGLYLRAFSASFQGRPSTATLIVMCAIAAVPQARDVAQGRVRRTLGADVLGLMAMVTAAIMGEWIVAAVIALMVSGGRALEEAASARASAVLDALARRSPTIAHLRAADGSLVDAEVTAVRVDDLIVVLPHELCPVDGTVLEGHGAMDESYLTGEPYVVPKTPGSQVLSGAINGFEALVIRSDHTAQNSRYAQIVGVLTKAGAEQPPMRRLADRIGLTYTVVAIALALAGWAVSGEPERFLAVLVIATPCPLLIGVPIAIIGAIAPAARYGIIIKDPSMLERISTARTMIFDKTGTLTYVKPTLSTLSLADGADRDDVLRLLASAEQYSRHPLAVAVTEATQGIELLRVDGLAEHPGARLEAVID